MDNTYILGTDGELRHWGIKGMKWGIRKYQNPDGSLTSAGKKRYNDELRAVKAKTKALKEKQAIKDDREKRKAKLKAAKEELAALKRGKRPEEAKKTKEEKAAEDDAAKKDRLLKTPDAKEVLANRHLFNEKEIQSIRLRLNEEKMIRDLQPPEIDKGKEFVNKTCDKFDQVSRLADSGSKAWNGVAKIYNSLYGKKNGIEVPLISDKTVSKLDKYKEETDWMNAKKARKDAEKALKEKVKTEEELYKEETSRLSRILNRKKVENQLREEEAKKAKMDNDEASEKARRKADADEKARRDNEEAIRREYEKASSTYRNSGGERTVINTGSVSRGQSLVTRSASSNAISPSIASRIRSMTSGNSKSYSEIAQQLGVSVSTVQNYSRGRDAAYEVLDRNGNHIIDFD